MSKIGANLPISNLSLGDIANDIGSGTSNISMSNLFTFSSINKWGISEIYVPGTDADARLSNLNNTPHNIGDFRDYDHDAPEPSGINISVIGIFDSTPTNDKLVGDVDLQIGGGGRGFITVDTISVNNELGFSVTFNDLSSGTYRISCSSIEIAPYQSPGSWGPPVTPSLVEWSFDGSNYTTGSVSNSFTSSRTVYFKFYNKI